MAYRTLGELESELLARLGMGAQGANGAAQTLLRSFLRNGQHQLYWAQDWKHLIGYADKSLGVSQNQIDYPTACARYRRVLRVETEYNGQWRVIPEGIRTEDWSTMSTQSYPVRCERYAQLLLYPMADQIYTIRFWYVADLGAFTQTGHAASLDDEMILLHALTNAKAHYRHPDATLYQGQLSTLMGSLRGQSFSMGGVYRRDESREVERKPVVI
jgi:hypothetical protein